MQKTSLVILLTGVVALGMWGISDYMAHKGEAYGNVERGQSIAEQTCLRCHTKFEGDPLPDPNVTNAPALASFGQRWPLENLEEALAEGITVSHESVTMPEFSFTPETIADLLSYMDKLTQKANESAKQ
ncbi:MULTISPECIES: c-type cytochrome [unclassified Thalassospira]|uniref:c-type cytochrome n=1 Tax=unclassified Thalassospira TaxID=2648997 RepID=UPI000ED60E96|nr:MULTISPECIES: cytochrome c [unclassified Thalassospira]HAI32103.1 cytochrome C [Thalassospira sp.]|tara:strand:- start:14929 stop:15315 length:387 start_codon:yes stop_codon:yes gene_type:complete